MKWNKLLGAFNNLDQIFEGIKNNVIKKEHVEQIADIRWADCSVCEHLDTDGKDCAVNGTQPCCSKCGCSMGLKIRALSSSCPIGKWKAVVTKEQEKNLKRED